jgi:hypothetical protein
MTAKTIAAAFIAFSAIAAPGAGASAHAAEALTTMRFDIPSAQAALDASLLGVTIGGGKRVKVGVAVGRTRSVGVGRVSVRSGRVRGF